MSDPKEESATAVGSLSSTLVSATVHGFPEIAKASSVITYMIVENFHFAPSPEAVSDRSYEELQGKISELETHIAAIPEPLTDAFRCKQDFEGCLETAANKTAFWHCLMVYAICLAHGFNLSFSLPGSSQNSSTWGVLRHTILRWFSSKTRPK